MARNFKECGSFEELTDEKQALFKKNFVIKTPMGRVTKKRATGRSPVKTPRQMLNGMNSYFAWCEKNDRVPSIKGMMLHMKMAREYFYRYSQYDDYKELMEQARLVMEEWVENDIYRTPGQAAGKIAYAKNIHGWADRLSTENITEIRNVISVDEAKMKIASIVHTISPALLEDLVKAYGTELPAHQKVITCLPEKL
jgi:hypothetical protein